MISIIDWKSVVDIVRTHKCQTRVKVTGWDESDWSATIFIPALGCLELPATGPVEVSKIEYLDIRVRYEKKLGKFAKPQVCDQGKEVMGKLSSLQVGCRLIEDSSIIRIETTHRLLGK